MSGKVLAVYEELETEEAIQTSIARVACMMPLAAVGPRTQSPRGSDRMLGSLSFQTFFFFCAGRLNPGSIVLGKGSAPSYIFSTLLLCVQPHQAQLTSAGEV